MGNRVIIFGSRLSPFVEKVARAATLKGLEFELAEPRGPQDFKRWNPWTGKMPVLDLDGERIYDSTFICRRLDELFPDPPLLSFEGPVAAAQRHLEDWADESLYWYGMGLRWTRTNSPATASQIFGSLPLAFRLLAKLFVGRRVRATTIAQGLGRLSEDVLLRELAGHLDDLVTILDNRPFFYADRISIADLAIHGQFHMLRSGPTPRAAELIESRAALMDHIRRVEDTTEGHAPR